MPLLKGCLKGVSTTFLMFSYAFLVLLRFFLVFASMSLRKHKKNHALVKFYVFLTQNSECTYNQTKKLKQSS